MRWGGLFRREWRVREGSFLDGIIRERKKRGSAPLAVLLFKFRNLHVPFCFYFRSRALSLEPFNIESSLYRDTAVKQQFAVHLTPTGARGCA